MTPAYVCEKMDGYSKKVVRVREEISGRVIGTFSFEKDLTPINAHIFSGEKLEALYAARTFLESRE